MLGSQITHLPLLVLPLALFVGVLGELTCHQVDEILTREPLVVPAVRVEDEGYVSLTQDSKVSKRGNEV